MRKKFKILIFSKMAPMILIKFCGFIVHSKTNNMALSAFPGKILTRKLFLNFLSARNVAPKPTDQSCSKSIFRVLLQLSPASPFHFRHNLNIKGTLKLRVVHIRNKKRSEWQTWNFTNMINCFSLNLRVDRKLKKLTGDICKGTLDIECERDWSVGLGTTLDDGQKIKNCFSSFRDFSGKSR